VFASRWWLGVLLACACGKGGPASTASGSASVGSIGEGPETGIVETSSVATGSTGSTSGDAGPSCTDLAQNGDETDIDCGGSCSPCDMGQACLVPTDCSTALCEGGLCCSASTYQKSTGEISGSAMVCCDGDDARLDLTPCGTGVNYSTEPQDPNCASTAEGAMNNGTACVAITCQRLVCVAGDSSTT